MTKNGAKKIAEKTLKELENYRKSIQKYKKTNKKLPLPTRATCPNCGEVVSAEFDWVDESHNGVVLNFHCKKCGEISELHYDTIWTTPQSDRKFSTTQTFAGAAIKPVLRGLPRTVASLCPECSAVIIGRYFVEDGAVKIEKNCPEHGYFSDIINSDVNLYLKSAHWSYEELGGLENPGKAVANGCPSDCGFCGQHQSCGCLANLDLTNRCNLKCPICFANANAVGYVYEPDFEQVVAMMQQLRDIRPTPETAIQFSGGEPTLHPRFHDIVKKAGEMGFSNIQIATNGLKMADYSFAQQAREAGLHTLYLQFDGTDPEIYKVIRGADIWDKKLKAIENCRKLDLKVCLVPTIIKTVNDNQVGNIFNFAVDNVDVISAISYQPVCFTGRIDREQRLRERYTLGDLAHDIAKVSGAVVERDFYPLSIVMPIAQFLEAVTGQPKIKPSCHTDCALGTYFLVSPDRQVYPFPQVIDVEGLFTGMNKMAHKLYHKGGKISFWDKLLILRMFKKVFRADQAPPGLNIKKFIGTLQGMVDKNKGRGSAGMKNYRTLMAAGMHFQDRYNYDVERVKRCVIPYVTPAGIFPFCTYNGGPTYRPFVEQMFAKEPAMEQS